MKNFTYTKKFYVHEIATVDLSKIYFMKNAKKTCKPNNRDLTRDWISLTSFNDFNKTGSQKYTTETQSIILKIYDINFPIYIIKIPGEFQLQKQPPVVFFK